MNCQECGGTMEHDRLSGTLELDFVRLVMECPECGGTGQTTPARKPYEDDTEKNAKEVE